MRTLFGTDGIRGTVGRPPFTLSDTVRLGQAIGTWVTTTYGENAHLLIAHDTRESGEWLLHSLCAGLLMFPLSVHVAGVLPTPAVSTIITQNHRFNCGIILSASHNPFSDNGIKMVDRVQGKLNLEDEARISYAYHHPTPPSYSMFGSLFAYTQGTTQYIASLISFFNSLSLDKLTIVLDCAHGATYKVAPAIFSALGARIILLHADPNGKNINEQSGALNPHLLQNAVIAHKADFGCAFDGDGDRVIMVNKKGDIKNGDDLLTLLSNHPLYQTQHTIVSTIMANQGLEQYLSKRNKKLLRTPVADRWVTAHLAKHALLLGGEQSGHVILQDYLPTGDGIATALRVIESVLHNNNKEMHTFETYPQKLINIPVTHKKDLKEPTIAAIIAQYTKQLDSGRICVRYSGTENLLRVMVEDRETDSVNRICFHLAHALEKELQ